MSDENGLASTKFFKKSMGIEIEKEDDGQGEKKDGEDVLSPEEKEKEALRVQAEKDALASKENQPTQEEIDKLAKEKEDAESASKATKADLSETYSKWTEENEDTLKAYYIEKSVDYTAMPAEKLLLKKLGEENPSLSVDEVKDLFEDEYGASEAKMEITAEMDEDDRELAEAHNKAVDKRARLLNAKSKKVAEEFEKRKESLEKPMFKVDVSEPDGVVKYTEEEFALKSQEQLETQDKEWKDFVDIALKPVEKFAYKELEVAVTAEENEAIKTAMLNYVPQAGDRERFGDGKDGVDMVKFTEHVAKSILLDKLLDSAKALTKAGINEKLINYEDKTKHDAHSQDVMSEKSKTVSAWRSMKGQ